MTYEPGVTVIAQGRKRVELGRNIFIYDATRFLLTPVVSRVKLPPVCSHGEVERNEDFVQSNRRVGAP